jgi:hypothetical protein
LQKQLQLQQEYWNKLDKLARNGIKKLGGSPGGGSTSQQTNINAFPNLMEVLGGF